MRDSGEFNIDIKNEEKLITSKRNSENELLLVAKVNGRIVGTLRFSSNRYNRYKHKGQFVISVLKDFWGNSIGTLLMETMISWADTYGFIKIKLEVDSNNTRAIKLYEKMGFQQEGILRMDKYIGNNTYIDSILMSRITLDMTPNNTY
jgi:RimJ/RimL family protein N-acetyltransferase